MGVQQRQPAATAPWSANLLTMAQGQVQKRSETTNSHPDSRNAVYTQKMYRRAYVDSLSHQNGQEVLCVVGVQPILPRFNPERVPKQRSSRAVLFVRPPRAYCCSVFITPCLRFRRPPSFCRLMPARRSLRPRRKCGCRKIGRAHV